MTGGGYMRDDFDELNEFLERALERQVERDRERVLRRANPYVLHLIDVLPDYRSDWLSRHKAIDVMERNRRAKGLPLPRRFDETVQSAFNQHCIHSNVFQKHNVPTDGFFLSRRVGNRAYWAVDRDRAAEWLAKRGLHCQSGADKSN